jgi:short-subunit dehydrogenase
MENGTGRLRALVTGASAGIGAEFARQLARDGYDLVLVARRREELDRLATEVAAAHGVTAEALDADLGAEDGVARTQQRIADERIDLLVNCAGFGTSGEFGALPLERELLELDVNVRALVRLSHAALHQMYDRRSGAIINVASTAAFQPVPNMALYGATKAFVLHFSEALHEESRRHSVTVTCLCPGPVRTEFQQVAGLSEGRIPSIAWTDVEHVVASAIRAMRAGQAISVPGLANRGGAISAKLLPRFVVRRIAGRIFRDAMG